MQEKSTLSKFFLTSLFLLAFVLVEYVYSTWMQNYFGRYYNYGFEFLFVVISLFLFKNFKMTFEFNKTFFFFLLGGFLIVLGTRPLGILVPFDLLNFEVILALLFIAPVLEELVFRYAIWEFFELIFGRIGAWILSSLLFSYSHYFIYPMLPDQFKPFVIYQTIYTFIIALYFGHYRKKEGSLFAPIVLHFLFNLGFFLGGRFFL